MVDIRGMISLVIGFGILIFIGRFMYKAFKNANRTMDGFTCKECGKKYNIKMETEKNLCQKCYDKRET